MPVSKRTGDRKIFRRRILVTDRRIEQKNEQLINLNMGSYVEYGIQFVI